MSDTDMDIAKLREELKLDNPLIATEHVTALGNHRTPYLKNYVKHIAFARDLERNPLPTNWVIPITVPQAVILLDKDIDLVQYDLERRLPFWRQLDPVRQRAMATICFYTGIDKLAEEWDFIASIIFNRAEWEKAAEALKLSDFAKTDPKAAARVIEMIRTGIDP